MNACLNNRTVSHSHTCKAFRFRSGSYIGIAVPMRQLLQHNSKSDCLALQALFNSETLSLK